MLKNILKKGLNYVYKNVNKAKINEARQTVDKQTSHHGLVCQSCANIVSHQLTALVCQRQVFMFSPLITSVSSPLQTHSLSVFSV